MSLSTRCWQARKFWPFSLAASRAPTRLLPSTSTFHTSVGRSDFLGHDARTWPARHPTAGSSLDSCARRSRCVRRTAGMSKTTLGGVFPCAGGPALAARTAGAAAATTAAAEHHGQHHTSCHTVLPVDVARFGTMSGVARNLRDRYRSRCLATHVRCRRRPARSPLTTLRTSLFPAALLLPDRRQADPDETAGATSACGRKSRARGRSGACCCRTARTPAAHSGSPRPAWIRARASTAPARPSSRRGAPAAGRRARAQSDPASATARSITRSSSRTLPGQS